MNLLSPPALAELAVLQVTVRELANNRSAALRLLRASRNVAVPSAQHEYWREFSWLDQKYRLAVRKLAAFCVCHAARAGCDERSQHDCPVLGFGSDAS